MSEELSESARWEVGADIGRSLFRIPTSAKHGIDVCSRAVLSWVIGQRTSSQQEMEIVFLDQWHMQIVSMALQGYIR